MKRETMRTWAEVSLDNIRRNIKEIKSAFGPETALLGVVKANAFGHGAVPVAKAMLDSGAEYLAVACLAEAEELRAAGINAPILIFGVTPALFAGTLEELGLTQTVGSLSYARELSKHLHGELKVHLKLDTGMGRLGFAAGNGAQMREMTEALKLPKLNFEGVFTHFAVSDCPGDSFTDEQYARFTGAVEQAESALGHRFKIRHCANSGAVINYKQLAMDMVRPGLISYGMYPAEERGGLSLLPALELKSRVYAITEHFPGDTISYGRTYKLDEPKRLAVVPIGYADGLHRVLSGKIDMLIRGQRCPQAGRICMDMCMVDISGVPDCAENDVVTVIGRDGDGQILADELAEKAGTINYEITCAITARVPRVYI
ncbi:MAG: alanine racemase [Butyricicoccus sp.]|nr:alanine racemase [Butyricicoccus sp.]